MTMNNLVIKTIATLFLLPNISFSQIKLSADGKTDTYELINSVLMEDNRNAVEVPDCNHKEYGKHITQVFDKTLNKYVFQFDIHINGDFDRCKRFDRQRNEMKTNKHSSDIILASEGETINYKWKFKLEKGFQVSSRYTDVHQITYNKTSGNEPLFAFMARKKKGIESFQVTYIDEDEKEVLKSIPLNTITDQWIVADETINYSRNGSYKVTLKTLDGTTILSVDKKNIQTWYDTMIYARPKWGIYRSLKYKEQLRDETLFFADIEVYDISKK